MTVQFTQKLIALHQRWRLLSLVVLANICICMYLLVVDVETCRPFIFNILVIAWLEIWLLVRFLLLLLLLLLLVFFELWLFIINLGVWSRSPPESRFWPRVGISHLKETPTLGPVCLLWTFVYFCCSLLDFCAIYVTTKTRTPFNRRI